MRKEKRSGWNWILTSLDGSVGMSLPPSPTMSIFASSAEWKLVCFLLFWKNHSKFFLFSLSLLTPAPTPPSLPQCFLSTHYAVGIT